MCLTYTAVWPPNKPFSQVSQSESMNFFDQHLLLSMLKDKTAELHNFLIKVVVFVARNIAY